MQGIFISGRRPKSKKEVKERAATHPEDILIEATSFIGDEYEGTADRMPEGGKGISFVGPDPYTSRRFYGTIVREGDKVKVS